MSLRAGLLTTTIAALLLVAAAPAGATPVKCNSGDVTPGDRIFPDPMLSTNFLRFDEFQCAIALLERTFPGYVQVTTIGTSAGGRPLYDVLITNESATTAKQRLLIMSSIHGDEVGGREGGARVMEEMVDQRFEASKPWAQQVLRDYVIHFVFPNPDGWVSGDVTGTPGAGVQNVRGNVNGIDLNRQLPVKGWIDTNNKTGSQPEGVALKNLFTSSHNWFLGTDNHGQSDDTYAAAGLQIVGQFDYQKSETLARFADGINETMKEYSFGTALGTLRDQTGQDLGPYHWGTLYDMLGYSASGSGIDYYNTPGLVNGTGFATELTVGREVNWAVYTAALNQVWVDAIRSINFTMFRQAVDRRNYTYTVGGKAAYVYDPKVITDSDADGAGPLDAGADQVPYRVTRMKFFTDLNRYADNKLTQLGAAHVSTAGLGKFDSLVLANGPLPEGDAAGPFYAALRRFVEGGGNLIVTDAAAKALAGMGVVPETAVSSAKAYVGYVDFANRTDALNQNLRGVARQTYDTVPIGYRFGSAATNSAPNWTVATADWGAAGGRTAGTNGTGRTIYGELPLGKGKISFLGALLPDPTEQFFHPYGLQNYAVTYTGYTLLQNMLDYRRPTA